MDIELFKKIVDEAANFLPVSLVPFFRGESFLHPQLFDMLFYAKQKGIRPIQLATNAFFLSPLAAKKLIELKIDFISFSVDVNNPEQYNKIRKNSDYEVVFSNILNFINLKHKLLADLPEIQVSAVKT